MTTRSFEETTARSIVFGAANRLTATRTAQTILERVIREAVSDRFATEVLDDCTTKKNRELEDWSKVDGGQLQKAFRGRMNAKYGAGGSTFFPTSGQVDFMPLGRWALCGAEGRKEVEQYLQRELAGRPSNIGNFLVRFFFGRKLIQPKIPQSRIRGEPSGNSIFPRKS